MDLIAIGRALRPFGRRGELRVLPMTDYPERFSVTRKVYLGASDRDALKAFDVELCRFHKGMVLLKLEGVDSISEAEALRGKMLWVPMEEAWKLPEGHHWIHEIIGLRALDPNGGFLGVVEEIMRTPANDVYVIRNRERELLVPAVREAVRSIDVPRGIMIVDAPEVEKSLR